MNISSALKSNRLCAAMTGLTIIEFGTLVPVFASVVDAMRREKHPRSKTEIWCRTSQCSAYCGRTALLCPFFISKATLLWMFFHFSLALTGVMLAETRSFVFCSYPCPRKKTGTPKRQITSVEEFFREFPEAKDIFIDGTERRVQNQSVKNGENASILGKRKQPPGKLWLSPMTGNESSSLRRPNPADVTTNASLTKPWEAEISHRKSQHGRIPDFRGSSGIIKKQSCP